MLAHQQLLEKTNKGKIDVYFEGNSIIRRWGATDYPDFLANWNAELLRLERRRLRLGRGQASRTCCGASRTESSTASTRR